MEVEAAEPAEAPEPPADEIVAEAVGESAGEADAAAANTDADDDAAAADAVAADAAADTDANGDTDAKADATAADAAADPSVAATEPVAAAEATVAAPASEPTSAPGQLYLDPSAFFTQLQAESTPKPKPKRWPRLLLRYASALVVAGAVGAGTAYAVTIPRRTDVPFLATPNDGRYVFPVIAKPAPPAGKLAPGDEKNAQQTHFGDLRRYLIAAPKGAVAVEEGWEKSSEFTDDILNAAIVGQLYDAGLQRIARRGWTAADGQHTVVELLQFPDHQAAYAVEKELAMGAPRKFGKAEDVVPTFTVPVLGDTTEEIAVRRFDTVDGLPGQMGRRAVFRNGDLLVVVTATAPVKVTDVAIDQVLTLQAEMLQ
ncbi:hypothetical protein ACFQ9X_47010 [Catenulispora yoronensis]